MNKQVAIAVVAAELALAQRAHAPQASPHEGWSVILEEVDELWQEVKANHGRGHSAAGEAMQVAAMALRYLVDVIPESVGALLAQEQQARLDKADLVLHDIPGADALDQ